MSAYSGGYFRGLNLVLGEYVGDNIRDVIQLHNLAVHDRVRLQVLVSHAYELEAAPLTLQFHGLDRTGTDVQTHEIVLADGFLKHDLFSPRNQLSAQALDFAKAKAGFARS